MIITKRCFVTNTVNSYDINMTQEEYTRVNNRFVTGELIQDIVPNLELWEREFLINGMSKDCQEAFFAEDTCAFEPPNVNDN